MDGATRIEAQIGRCSKCDRTLFVNELVPVQIGNYKCKLCPPCERTMLDILADKVTVGFMIKAQMSALELCRMIDERREDAAASCHD